MKKLTFPLTLLCLAASLPFLFFAVEHAFAVERAAEDAMNKAQETMVTLEDGLENAEVILQQIKDRGTENEYRIAREIKEEAERMLAAASKHRDDSTDMAEEFHSASTDTVATAVSYTSRAEADTARTYAKIGLLFLKALQFAADNELDCAEETNDALRDKQRTWRTMKKIVALADKSLEHASSAISVQETAAEEADKGTETAKECIALAKELNLLLENFEDICNDFIKEWENIKDHDDDEEPSPV